MTITVDLNPQSPKHNPKQREYFDVVMGCISRSHRFEKLKVKLSETTDEELIESLSLQIEELEKDIITDYRYFKYGGAVSGGKSYINCVILLMLCKLYPNSRWHIIRKAMPDLERTVVETLNEIRGTSKGWKRTKADLYLEHPNGSRIYLMAENYERDKDLNRFKGLLTNGFLLEQMEELQRATFGKAIERAGRWRMVKGVMPPPIVLGTFNPTFGWLKKEIHDKSVTGELVAPYYYLQALPSDNPWNTDEQWRSWQNLDQESYDRFIKGIWDIPVTNQFCTGFNEHRNVKPCEFDPRYPLYLSFDFNVDPMTCIIAQSDGMTFNRILREFRQPDSDTYGLCESVKSYIEGIEHLVIITGDASGQNRMSGVRGHTSQYHIIREQLGVDWVQFDIPTVNPFIADSRVFMNSLLSRLPEFIIDPSCEHLINDLKFVELELDREGKIGIKKTGVNKAMGINNNQLGHLFDCLRYQSHVALKSWHILPKS